MERHIRKAAVLGSGVMGSRIACHFANVGIQVLLLDIAPKELNEAEKAAGLELDNKKVKNRIVNEALQSALKSNPAPIYKKADALLISTGNFDDDMKSIADCDWIIEVVVENIKIKKIVFEQVEKFRKPGTLITSNTSGIPIEMMLDGRSDDFKKHFCGTHFFNPPRYLKLLEIIPSSQTAPEVTQFFLKFGDLILGKTTVQCKDTPAFIANRIGVFSIMSLFHLVEEMGLTIDEVDKLTGPALGRPKSATFRTCDVVGLDTLVKVAEGVQQNCPNDEANSVFAIPSYISKMVANGWLGSKSKQGFYKQDKSSGKKEILSLNLKTLEYEAKKKANFATLEMAKNEDNLKKRIKILVSGTDKAGDFYRKTFAALFVYVSNRVPEISDEIYRIDHAMKAGFDWELGPFELWDAVGVKESLTLMQQAGVQPAAWVNTMVEGGKNSFYNIIVKTYIFNS